MRRALLIAAAAAALAVPAHADGPSRGAGFCWDFELAGTDAPDHLNGTAGSEHAAGYGGTDVLALFGGDDCAAGGSAADVLHLGPGDDTAFAGSGADTVFGGPGADRLHAGLGVDRLEGGAGDDVLRDERGDFTHDTLDCGPGEDLAYAGATDTVTGCERVVRWRVPAVRLAKLRAPHPVVELRFDATALALPAHARVEPVQRPARRRACTNGPWHVADETPRGRARVLLKWRGDRPACPGRYVWRLTLVGGGPRGLLVACERRAEPYKRMRPGAPAGCPPEERVGDAILDLRPRRG